MRRIRPSDLGDLTRRKTLMFADPGTGKTWTLGNLAREHRRALLVDPVRGQPLAGWADPLPDGSRSILIDRHPGADVLDQVVKRAADRVRSGKVTALNVSTYVGNRAQLGHDLGRSFLKHLRDCIVLIDEAHWYLPSGSFQANAKDPKVGMFEAIGQGRNQALGFVLSEHRLQQLDTNASELCDLVILGAIKGRHNLRAAKELLRNLEASVPWLDADAVAAQLPGLQVGQVVVIDQDAGAPKAL